MKLLIQQEKNLLVDITITFRYTKVIGVFGIFKMHYKALHYKAQNSPIVQL